MKSSMMMIMATTMMATTAHATNNPNVINISDFANMEYLVENDNNQHFLQEMACHCGEEDYAFKLLVTVQPFKFNKKVRSFRTESPYNQMSEEEAMQLYMLLNAKPVMDSVTQKMEDLLDARDDDGNTVLDILTQRANDTGHVDCIEMKKQYEDVSKFINEYKKPETQVAMQMLLDRARLIASQRARQ